MKDNKRPDLKEIADEAMIRYGFETQFRKSVIAEVDSLGVGRVIPEVSNGIVDMRSILWSSIDNADSMDLDQLEFAKRGDAGEINVRVAIADVDSFVSEGSQSDQQAGRSTTSVYTGIRVFPMLHQRLSEDLTSLRQGQDRLAVTVEFVVLPDGSVRHVGISRALVRNKAKLVYEEVGEWLDGKGPIPQSVASVVGLEEQLRLQDEASQRLADYRMEKGALDLDTMEVRPMLQDETVTGLAVPGRNRAHYIIENFMIAANGAMMDHLEKEGLPAIQRVVRTPRDWDGIRRVAAEYRQSLPTEPDSKALARFLRTRKQADPERFQDLSLTVVKLLGSGEYVLLQPGNAPIGHFGLAVTDYTHSTAPNRRYVDLIIQRLIKASLNRQNTPYTSEELAGIAAWCTEREKASNKVERFMRKAAAAVLLASRIGESFDAIVTGASEKGTYVRLLVPPAEGRLMRGYDGLSVGRKIRVRLVEANPYKGFIDFVREDGGRAR
jgi:VacB/RNase II family 3'-5' exoribonuclease